MRSSTDFAPGDMLRGMQDSAPVTLLPGNMDVILYLVIIFKVLPVEDEQRVTVKNGALQLMRVLTDEGKLYRVSILDFKGNLQFLAVLSNENKWEFIRSELTEHELILLEHTYDKVRSSMTSIEHFINEYPPIGIS